jgi:hypothetical protein
MNYFILLAALLLSLLHPTNEVTSERSQVLIGFIENNEQQALRVVFQKSKDGWQSLCSPTKEIETNILRTPLLRKETLEDGSPLSFLGAYLTAPEVAEKILEVINSPKREVMIHPIRGWIANILTLSPSAMAFLYPVLERICKINLRKYKESMCQSNSNHTLRLSSYISTSNFLCIRINFREYSLSSGFS